ncbi:MAG: aldehyde dehydrogenase family protein [Oligoflexia bacterium]|nr:aldehyde dehydrogenase family protein [Oligoflexia bacterium]
MNFAASKWHESINKEVVLKSIEASCIAFESFKNVSRATRSELLNKIALGIELKRNELRDALISEAKKPYLLSDIEINRAINTFKIASEEVKRFGGDVIPMDTDYSSKDYHPAISQWFPRGPVLAIAPYNFPLNLVAHKVAPALAVGASVIIKPPPQAPKASEILTQIFQAAIRDLKESVDVNVIQVISPTNEDLSIAFDDARITTLSFTGSDSVGWYLKSKNIKKKVILELGGNAAVVICNDADLKRAALRCAIGAFAYAGQVCISVQRIFVEEAVMPQFTELFIEEVKKLKVGDANLKDVVVGPVINLSACTKIMTYIDEAITSGAKLIYGGKNTDLLIEPTVLLNVKNNQKLFREEVFGPVAFINTFKTFDEAINMVNDSRFGLQAGVFTNNQKLVDLAFNKIQTGAVIINDTPTFRADHAPYGGIKESGEGREGVRYTMEEYSERKTLIRWREQ